MYWAKEIEESFEYGKDCCSCSQPLLKEALIISAMFSPAACMSNHHACLPGTLMCFDCIVRSKSSADLLTVRKLLRPD